MSNRSVEVESFEQSRAVLLSLAYRMLGDMGRAEDVVQDAWLRFRGREAHVEAPRAFLIKVVTHLCLNELGSARARRERPRGDQLPEPVTLQDSELARVECLDRISMAFLVLLQRLTPAERAVFLLHEVFDFTHADIAAMVSRTEPACRQLLRRARKQVEGQQRALRTSRVQHEQLTRAFLEAARSGDLEALKRLLSEDAILIADAGPEGGEFGGARNVGAPIHGATKVAAFVAAVTPRGAEGLVPRPCEINGEPALLVMRQGRPHSAIVLSVHEDRIAAVFIHADPARLTRLS